MYGRTRRWKRWDRYLGVGSDILKKIWDWADIEGVEGGGRKYYSIDWLTSTKLDTADISGKEPAEELKRSRQVRD